MKRTIPLLEWKRRKLSNSNIIEIERARVEVNEFIGAGSFADVYKAYLDGGTLVAFKVFKCNDWDSEGKKIIKEGQINNQLDIIPNIARHFGLCFKPFSLVLEYCCFDFNVFGSSNLPVVSTLRKFLDFLDNISMDGFEYFAKKCVTDIIAGTSFLHKNGVAHRALKPGNVLVSNQHYLQISDETERLEAIEKDPVLCKPSDFGESRSQLYQTKTALATNLETLMLEQPRIWHQS